MANSTPLPGTAQAGPAVIAHGLTKTFGEHTVLSDFSMTIEDGEFVALLGRSGSGKSTFLRILGALDTEFSGTLSAPLKRAVVFQDPRLLPWQDVITNVTLGMANTSANKQAAIAALNEVGLTRHANVWPKTLSGGEAQRVALARALVRSPELLLLDEPFGALDALTKIRMHALLKSLCAAHRPSVLLVTHDVDEAILLADRILVLTQGRITFDRPVSIPERNRRE